MRDQTPWIEFHAGVRENSKIGVLASSLQIPYAHAVGLMGCLWASPHAINHDGNLTGCTDAFIAGLAKWEGSINGFVGYLKAAKLLDADLRLHDYSLHGTKMLRDARARKDKWKAAHPPKKKKR